MTTKARAYKLLKDSVTEKKAKAGMVIYALTVYDYNVAMDDTEAFGFEHKSMTLDPTGAYPFFTVPLADLELVTEDFS